MPIVYSKKKRSTKLLTYSFNELLIGQITIIPKKKKLQGVSFTLCNIHVTVPKKRNVRRLFFFPLPCACI